jgi:branched-chain amino acid transport system ATP-binding protein
MTDAVQPHGGRAARLDVQGLTVAYGGVVALHAVDLAIAPGEITGLIGPNGSGKTTLFNALTGWVRPDAGCVLLDGRDITGLPPHAVARLGVARSFQLVSIFPELSCAANVLAGFHLRLAGGIGRPLLRPLAERRMRQECLREAEELLAAVGLGGRIHTRAADLSYGDWKRVDVARSLAMRPRILLLDEPGAGLEADEKSQLAEVIRRTVAEHELTLVVVEHDVGFVRGLCERVVVLNEGRVLAEGTPSEIYESSAVAEVYLGG